MSVYVPSTTKAKVAKRVSAESLYQLPSSAFNSCIILTPLYSPFGKEINVYPAEDLDNYYHQNLFDRESGYSSGPLHFPVPPYQFKFFSRRGVARKIMHAVVT